MFGKVFRITRIEGGKMNIKKSIYAAVACLSIGFVLVPCLTAQTHDEEEAYVPQKVIILGSYKDYPRALKAAKEISSKTEVPFYTRGMIYDKKEGLIWPKDSEDEIYSGTYMVRRYNDDCGGEGQKSCITIERSRFYQGMEPGYYILVGGIFSEKDPDVEKSLRSFQSVVPDAYTKVSKVYMGCLH